VAENHADTLSPAPKEEEADLRDLDAKDDPSLDYICFGPRVLSDFEIQLGSTVFLVHKLILYRSSEYFKTLFDQQPLEYDSITLKGYSPTLYFPDFLSAKFRKSERMALNHSFGVSASSAAK